VFGLVYIPSLQRAHWVNVKRYLKTNAGAASVRFAATEANRLDRDTFTALFMRAVLGQTPVLEIDEAFRLARSNKADELTSVFWSCSGAFPTISPYGTNSFERLLSGLHRGDHFFSA
jgi:hypothetical protein